MSPADPVDEILRDPRIWQGKRVAGRFSASVSSGWHELDEALNGGWPLGQLTELLIDAPGVGEFALLLPALRRLMSRDGAGTRPGWVAFVAAPHIPYAPALARAGIDLSRLLLVRSKQETDTLWALEQTLRAQTCVAVLAWSASRNARALRRLQLAAEAGATWAVLFRPAAMRSSRSFAPLRIYVSPARTGGRLVLNVLKSRAGPTAVVGVDADR